MLPAVSIMGVSVSLLSPAAVTAAAVVITAAGCFAAGYFLALSSLPAPIDDDEKDPKSKLRRRLLRWTPQILAGRTRSKGSTPEAAVDDKTKQKKKPALEIENLAEILEDFKMVNKVEIFSVLDILLDWGS